MKPSHFILSVLCFVDLVRAIAIPSAVYNNTDIPSILQKVPEECEHLAPFLEPKAQDWADADTDYWFDYWWITHGGQVKPSAVTVGGPVINSTSEIEEKPFVEVWGLEMLGNPHWCLNGGSGGSCNYNPCDISGDDDSDRDVFYVTESVFRMSTYFDSMHEALQDAAIWAAFEDREWFLTFNPHKDKAHIGLKAGLITLGAVAGVAAAVSGLAGAEAAAVVGSMSALYAAAASAYLIFHKDEDKTFKEAAEFGTVLGEIVINLSKELISSRDKLLLGRTIAVEDSSYDLHNIHESLQGGDWLGFKEFDQVKAIDGFSNILLASAINALWKTQFIFILGGFPCEGGEDWGGEFHHRRIYCYKGKGWKLQWFKEHQEAFDKDGYGWWGATHSPEGAKNLGLGIYKHVTIENVFKASLGAWQVAGVPRVENHRPIDPAITHPTGDPDGLIFKNVHHKYKYYDYIRQARIEDAMAEGVNPGDQGANWEGTFNIPVCEIALSYGWDEWDCYNTWCAPDWENESQRYCIRIWGYEHGPIVEIPPDEMEDPCYDWNFEPPPNENPDCPA